MQLLALKQMLQRCAWQSAKVCVAVCITLKRAGTGLSGVLVSGAAAHPGDSRREGCAAVCIVQPHGAPAQLRCLLQDALCADGGPQLLLPWRWLPAASEMLSRLHVFSRAAAGLSQPRPAVIEARLCRCCLM